jgi:hypothetical protein
MHNEVATAWLTVAKAAPRLGLTPDGLRSRIKRGQISARKGNDGRLLVGVALNGSDPGHEPGRDPGQNDPGTGREPGHEPAGPGSVEPDHDLLHDLLAARERAARAEGELAAEARRSTDLQAALALERSRADRLEVALALARRGWLDRLMQVVRGRE